MSEIKKSKKKSGVRGVRGKNYLPREKIGLITICSEYKHILECKKTDEVNTKDKERVWDTITGRYHTEVATTGDRSKASLQHVYDCVKSDTRKVKADQRVDHIRTGGGKAAAREFDPAQLVMLKTLEGQLSPYQNEYDCDAAYHAEAGKNEFFVGIILD
jgi:Myb/SANT-like DNA-binding domain